MSHSPRPRSPIHCLLPPCLRPQLCRAGRSAGKRRHRSRSRRKPWATPASRPAGTGPRPRVDHARLATAKALHCLSVLCEPRTGSRPPRSTGTTWKPPAGAEGSRSCGFGRAGGQVLVRPNACASRDSACVKAHVLVLCVGMLTVNTVRPAVSAIETTIDGSSRFSRALTRSVAGMGWSSVSLVKVANIDPRRGSSTASF
jgi:hypothetical protein